MIPLAYLIMDDDPPGLFEPQDLQTALVVCSGITALWLVLAFLGKRKGKPLELSYGFWCVAAPGILGLAMLLIGFFAHPVATIIILALLIAVPIIVLKGKSRKPNKTPLPTPGKCPPSNHSPVPGAADL